jgi:hypothetical protein
MVGIVCLHLSDAVAHPGSWWQGTLDAFGVGFVVGGLIDVIAVSGLNQILILDQRRKELNRQANTTVVDYKTGQSNAREAATAATELLRHGRRLLDSCTVAAAPVPDADGQPCHTRAIEPRSAAEARPRKPYYKS